MPHFSATKRVAASADVAYQVAADVGAYKEFLPLLQRSQLRGDRRIENGVEIFEAELVVGYEKLGLREAFVSRVTCDASRREVKATSSEGAFRSMQTVWSIKTAGSQCDVTVTIDYALKNPLLQFAVAGAIGMAVEKIMAAFEQRTKLLATRADQVQA
jgi:coenzyme Q-binding protein COQ10